VVLIKKIKIMAIIEMLLKEMDQEALTTKKMLERVPNDKYGWKPHEKSMSIRQLSTHIAELPTWITMVLTTDELDFATQPYQPVKIDNTTELLELFKKSLANGREHLAAARETIFSVTTKGEVIRMTFSQIVHHRAQLGVYLRLLNIPIPGSYGPSADEQ